MCKGCWNSKDKACKSFPTADTEAVASLRDVISYWVQVPRHRRALWEAAGGAPCRTRAVPVGSNGPSTGHGPAPQLPWRCLGAVWVRKSKTLPGHEEWGKKCEEQPWEPWEESGRREEVLQASWQGSPAAPGETKLEQVDKPWRIHGHGGPMLEQAYPEGVQHMGKSTVEQRKSVKRKKQQRGAVMDWPQSTISHPLVTVGEGGKGRRDAYEEVKLRAWNKEVGGKVVLQFVLVSYYPKLF